MIAKLEGWHYTATREPEYWRAWDHQGINTCLVVEGVPVGVLEAVDARMSVIYERMRPNGTILEIQNIPLADGGNVVTYADVTARRRYEDKIRHLAHHDPLTDLANRTLLQQRLAEGIARAQAQAAQ